MFNQRSLFTTMRRVTLGSLFVVAGALATGFPAAAQAQSQTSTAGRIGVSRTVTGHLVTAQELASRANATRPATRPVVTRRGVLPPHAAPTNLAPADPSQAIAPAVEASTDSRKLPQALGAELQGLEITDTLGFVPPDTMGVVGPTQYLFTVNGQFRAFLKTPPYTQVFSTDSQAFWGSTGQASSANVSDTHA